MPNRFATLVLAGVLLAAALTIRATRAQQPSVKPTGPLYVATFIDVIPTNTIAATMAIERYVADSRKEPGSVRAEALAQDGRANHMVMLEVWRDQASLDAHEGSATTRDFRARLQPMLGAPFDQRVHHLLP